MSFVWKDLMSPLRAVSAFFAVSMSNVPATTFSRTESICIGWPCHASRPVRSITNAWGIPSAPTACM
jgi:hypothetical protein